MSILRLRHALPHHRNDPATIGASLPFGHARAAPANARRKLPPLSTRAGVADGRLLRTGGKRNNNSFPNLVRSTGGFSFFADLPHLRRFR
jgi:hypothetical protein